jgi:hypothetical protein
MDFSVILLFVLGALGALLTIYIGKQELVPEFRALIDVSAKIDQAKRIHELLENTQKDIDCWQKTLTAGDTSSDLAAHLSLGIDKSFEELKYYRDSLKPLQDTIDSQQILSRVIGFFIYVIMGGVFAVFLAGIIKIEGASFELTKYVIAFVIGTAWTSYLSTIGIKRGQDKADQRLQDSEEKSAQELVKMKDNIISAIERGQAVVEKPAHQLADSKENIVSRPKQPRTVEMGPITLGDKLDPALAKAIMFNFDKAASNMKSDFKFTRAMVHRDLKGVL